MRIALELNRKPNQEEHEFIQMGTHRTLTQNMEWLQESQITFWWALLFVKSLVYDNVIKLKERTTRP